MGEKHKESTLRLRKVNDLTRALSSLLAVLSGAGGEALVKSRIAEALEGKNIILLAVPEGGMNLKTTDGNRHIETLGTRSLGKSEKKPDPKEPGGAPR